MAVGIRECPQSQLHYRKIAESFPTGSGMGLGSLILISTAVLFMFFVVLSGVKDHTPLNKVWFLQADTSHIAGSPRPLSQWTYFYVCGNQNKNCGSPVPALPLGYAWKGDNSGAPAALVG